MKKLLSMFALVAALGFGYTSTTFAEDAMPAAEAAAEVVTTEAAPVADAAAPVAEVAPAATEEAPAAEVTVNKGDTAWMMVATLLVIMMVVPGLALFYGGLVRSKTCCLY